MYAFMNNKASEIFYIVAQFNDRKDVFASIPKGSHPSDSFLLSPAGPTRPVVLGADSLAGRRLQLRLPAAVGCGSVKVPDLSCSLLRCNLSNLSVR